MVSDGGWSRPFDEPIQGRGLELITLRDAADYIVKLPKAEQNLDKSQTAVAYLLGAARDFLMHAQIGMLRALNRNEGRK